MSASEGALNVLCAGIAGGTSLSESLAEPEAIYAMQRCEKRIRRSVENYGGRLVDLQGSKLMAFFANGADALQSAIVMQRRVAELPPHSGFPLAVRVGLCTGHQAREGRYFPAAGANPAASLSSVAEPGRILLSIPKRAKLFPWLELTANSLPDVDLSCGKRRLGVFQVPWQERDPVALRLALADPGNGAGRLCVTYRGIEMMLDETQPVIHLGRLADCDLTVRDPRCSRRHGTIERRLDCFVFVDRSTNGTFVTHEGQVETFVHNKEIILFGNGHLSLGASASAKGAELVAFQTAGLLP